MTEGVEIVADEMTLSIQQKWLRVDDSASTSPIGLGNRAKKRAEMNFAVHCISDGLLSDVEIAGLELDRATRNVSISRGGSIVLLNYRDAVDRVATSTQRAASERTRASHGNDEITEKRGAAAAFFDGLSRTLGVFGPRRQAESVSDTVSAVSKEIREAIDAAQASERRR